MTHITDILDSFLSKHEIEKIKLILDSEITSDNISKYFGPERAKDISDILFINRSLLRDNDEAAELYVESDEYYNNSISLNLILGKDALVPAGMCALRDESPYQYESLY